jgi:hypothetical protein
MIAHWSNWHRFHFHGATLVRFSLNPESTDEERNCARSIVSPLSAAADDGAPKE